MPTFIFILTFFISLTGLFFKTTNDPNKSGIKKINQWGWLLLILMSSLLFLNIYISYEAKQKAKIENANIIEKERLKRENEELKWKNLEQEWINQKKSNELQLNNANSQIKTLHKLDSVQHNDIVLRTKWNNYLSTELSNTKLELANIRFPIDTLYLSLELELELKSNQLSLFKSEVDKTYPSGCANLNLIPLIKKVDSAYYLSLKNTESVIRFDESLANLGNSQKRLFFGYNMSNLNEFTNARFKFFEPPTQKTINCSAIYYDESTNKFTYNLTYISPDMIIRTQRDNLSSMCNMYCSFEFSKLDFLSPYEIPHFNILNAWVTKGDRHFFYSDFKEYSKSQFFSTPYRCDFK